jgi:hypothetical protein
MHLVPTGAHAIVLSNVQYGPVLVVLVYLVQSSIIVSSKKLCP